MKFDDVFCRQNAIPGYATNALRQATVLGIGAGGLGSFVYGGLARKGIGAIRICDEDTVEKSNLNRQGFFEADLFRPKALRLAANVSRLSLCAARFTGHRIDFNADSADCLSYEVDLAFVGVDNNQTRAFASRYFRRRRIPVIFAAVNERADYGYVFVQKPGGACLGCVFPDAMRAAEREARKCTASPAAIDILQGIGALALYALDCILMPGRRCDWTFRSLNLMGVSDIAAIATQLPDCPLCSTTRPVV